MKNFKKMAAIVVTVVMCFMMNMNTSANVLKAATKTEATEGSWIDAGNFTKDWVSSVSGQDVYGNQGTASDPYEIHNEKDLAGLSYCSNDLEMTFEGKYINITATELDMSQHYWAPIGEYNPIFGTINGNGCMIKNVFIGSENAYYQECHVGLIGQSYANINKVNIKNFIYYTNSYNIGGLIGSWSSGNVDGCSAEGIIFNTFSTCSIGGLIGIGQIEEGDSLGNVMNCSAVAEIGSYMDANAWEDPYSGHIGGLIGSLNAETRVENCTVDTGIEVGNKYYVGGLVGFINANTTLSKCSVTFDIHTQNGCLASGLVGKSSSCTLNSSDCNASGTLLTGNDL